MSRAKGGVLRRLTARERMAADAAAGWAPACIDADEWAAWRARNPLVGVEADLVARPCEECPLGFAADMRAQGRCNGEPGGVAEPDDTEEEPMDPVTPAAPAVRVTVSLAPAPCGRCEKADVCALRPTVEGLSEIAASLPALDRRIGLELTGSVSCAAFAKARIRRADPSELEPRAPRKLQLSPEERERRRQRLAVNSGRVPRQAAAS